MVDKYSQYGSKITKHVFSLFIEVWPYTLHSESTSTPNTPKLPEAPPQRGMGHTSLREDLEQGPPVPSRTV